MTAPSAPPAADRLRQALARLASVATTRKERVTLTALCEAANVSRNSVYRYHPQVLRALREHQRQVERSASRRSPEALFAQQAELERLRKHTTKLAALVDHYYAAYREAAALLTRRERELAELRRQMDSRPARLGR